VKKLTPLHRLQVVFMPCCTGNTGISLRSKPSLPHAESQDAPVPAKQNQPEGKLEAADISEKGTGIKIKFKRLKKQGS